MLYPAIYGRPEHDGIEYDCFEKSINILTNDLDFTYKFANNGTADSVTKDLSSYRDALRGKKIVEYFNNYAEDVDGNVYSWSDVNVKYNSSRGCFYLPESFENDIEVGNVVLANDAPKQKYNKYKVYSKSDSLGSVWIERINAKEQNSIIQPSNQYGKFNYNIKSEKQENYVLVGGFIKEDGSWKYKSWWEEKIEGGGESIN